MTVEEKFWKKVSFIPFHPCWEWTGTKNEAGYGVLTLFGRDYRAHRLSLGFTGQIIPDDRFVLHSCDNRGCVNPRHLRVGTNRDNVDDMVSRGRSLRRSDIKAEELTPLLGTVADSELAKRFNCTKYLIAYRRKLAGIKAFPCSTRFKSGEPHPRWSKRADRNPSH